MPNLKEESEADYLRRLESYKATLKRTPEKRDAGVHFEWTALYHVAGLRLREIADRYDDGDDDGLELGSVSEAINSVANLIGLTLRRKQGRPKKT
jgi:hypothetical protein